MSIDELKARGNAAFKAKQYKEAIDLYTQAIAKDPYAEGAGALYSNRAASWQGLSKYAEAAADADLCIKIRPDWLKGHFRKGVALQSLNRLDDAQKAFREALKLEPNNEEVMDRLQAINSLLRERNEKAKPSACKMAEEAKQLGNSLFADSRYEQAAAFYTRAIELQKEPTKEKSTYFSNRAACYQQTHMYSLMIEDCTAAIEIDPQNVKAYIRRAIAYEGIEKWKLALEDYQTANALSPGLPNVSSGVLRCQRAIRG